MTSDRILFVVPPALEFEDFVNPSDRVTIKYKKDGDYGSVLTEPPLGVLALSAYVKKHTAAKVKLIDFNVVLNQISSFGFGSYKDFFHAYLSTPELADYAPNIIGISALFMLSYREILDLAQCCRNIFPDAIIVAGGGVATNMYNEIFSDSTAFDALCYGEGEKPLLGLIEADNKLRYLEENPQWISREKIEKGQLFRHDFIENLDEIPLYDYSLCDIEAYRLNSSMSVFTCTDDKNQYITVMTSRGCPHRCCFCSAHTVHGRSMRYYSIPRIKEDFKRIKDTYGAKTIIFQDDHFMANKKRVFEIINILKELQVTAFFPNSLALYALDREILAALKSAGVNHLVLAIESGSDRVLREIMHKPLNRSIIKRVTDDCRRLGIYMDATIIIGFPGETKKDIEDTRLFLRTTNVNWFRMYIATPLVGSELFDICRKKNYFKDNPTKCNYKKSNITTEDFTAEYIQETAYALNLELNFVENSDFRLGNYSTALKGFENAIRARNDHAIAYYYAAQCYEKLGDDRKAKRYMDTARAMAERKPFWRGYVEMFDIPL